MTVMSSASCALTSTCSDFHGAVDAGMQGLLLRRIGRGGEQAHKEPDETLGDIEVIENLEAVIPFVREKNSNGYGIH